MEGWDILPLPTPPRGISSNNGQQFVLIDYPHLIFVFSGIRFSTTTLVFDCQFIASMIETSAPNLIYARPKVLVVQPCNPAFCTAHCEHFRAPEEVQT